MVEHALVAGVTGCGGADATFSTQAFTAWLVHGVVGELFGVFAATYREHPRVHSALAEHDPRLAMSAALGRFGE